LASDTQGSQLQLGFIFCASPSQLDALLAQFVKAAAALAVPVPVTIFAASTDARTAAWPNKRRSLLRAKCARGGNWQRTAPYK